MVTKKPNCRVGTGKLIISLILIVLTQSPLQHALAEKNFFAGYKGGFYIRSEEEGGMELLLGGVLQTDYRYYLEEERADNRFDIRRAHLRFKGQLTEYFRFKLEFKFQGNKTDNLVDAYVEAVFNPSALRLGQFKEPYSLEWQSPDKAQFFAERSMGYYLGPMRDVGIMLHGSLFKDTFNYAAGLFNGDGGSASGDEEDDPEAAVRIVISPFKNSMLPWLKGFQLGASAAYAQIDPLNLNFRVKSTGMVGTDLNLYVLKHETKFGEIQDVESRQRFGVEAAWAVGPLLFQGEYFSLKYIDLESAGDNPGDAEFSSWYASLTWCLTGESPILSGGIVRPIYPQKFFNPQEGTWGTFCLALRVEQFNGDENWINPASYVSVKQADAYSLALNWVIHPMARVVLDYTHTDLSDPIRVRVLPDGSADYIEAEDSFTFRFSIDY